MVAWGGHIPWRTQRNRISICAERWTTGKLLLDPSASSAPGLGMSGSRPLGADPVRTVLPAAQRRHPCAAAAPEHVLLAA